MAGFRSSSFQINLEESKSKVAKNPDLYSPTWSRELPDGKYVAYIRLLPNMLKETSPIMKKCVSWLRNPMDPNARAFAVDSPETIGQKDNIVTNLFWNLRNTKDDAKIKLAGDCLRTTSNYYSYVQIISDPNIPQEEAYKVKLMRYGKTLYDLIVAECNDAEYAPFDLCNGQILKLIISRKNGQNAYELSKFVDPARPGKDAPSAFPTGYCYYGDDGQLYMATPDVDDDTAAEIEKKLTDIESQINIEDAQYHPWTPEIEEKVRQHCELVQQCAYPELVSQHQVIAGAVPQVPTTSPAAQPFAQPVSAVRPQAPASAPVPQAPVAQPVAQPVAAARPVAAPVMPTNRAPQVASAPQVSAGYDDADLNSLLGED